MAKLATEADINANLDGNKLSVSNTDDVDEQRYAESVIKGRLFGFVDAVTMASWDASVDPNSVPGIIRTIAGLLIASKRYRKAYSEDVADRVTPYGQQLYNEALSMLEGVVNGQWQLYDVPTTAIVDTGMQEGMFYPDDNAAILDCNNDKKFRMSDRF